MLDPFDPGGPGGPGSGATGAQLDTLILALERGWSALSRGDLDAADRVSEEALTMDDGSTDAHCLRAAVLMGRGRDDLALEHARTAIAIEPTNSLALLQGADLLLYSHQAPDQALELAARAAECARFDDDFVEALLLRGESELALDEVEETKDTLTQLAELGPQAVRSGEHRKRTADLALGVGDLDGAEGWYREALEARSDLADAHYGLGIVAERRGDRAAMVENWQRVRHLDEGGEAPEWHLSEEAFARCAERALADLPARARDLLENVPILVAPRPSEGDVADGIDPRLLGLFSGVALPEQVTGFGTPQLPTIHLYQANLEATCRSRDHLEREIAITLWHETAHYFGLDDDDLDTLGLG